MTITQVRPIAVVFTLPQRNLPPIVEEMAQAAGDGRGLVGRGQS